MFCYYWLLKIIKSNADLPLQTARRDNLDLYSLVMTFIEYDGHIKLLMSLGHIDWFEISNVPGNPQFTLWLYED